MARYTVGSPWSYIPSVGCNVAYLRWIGALQFVEGRGWIWCYEPVMRRVARATVTARYLVRNVAVRA